MILKSKESLQINIFTFLPKNLFSVRKGTETTNMVPNVTF